MTRRPSTALLALACIGPWLAACGADSDALSPPHELEETTRADSVEEEAESTTTTAPLAAPLEPFQLELRRDSGAIFRDQLSIRSDGQLVWLSQIIEAHRGTVHAVTLHLDDAEVRTLRGVVERVHFFDLHTPSSSGGAQDGDRLIVRIHAGERTRRLAAEEPIPVELSEIAAAVDAVLSAARRAELAAAPEAQPEDFDSSLLAETE